tara:strand:+ start:137 stop:955 length:819 start_codon:yes stop_codon:yes gene_type:complete
MPYYPLSQIQTNFQTDGTELETSDGVPYVGFYYKVSTGKKYTGSSPQSGGNQELFTISINEEVPNENTEENSNSQIIEAFALGDIDPYVNPKYQATENVYFEYVNLTSSPKTTTPPYFNPNYPTDEDYTIGEFRRYFCKRANNIIYLEIDKTQYDLMIQKSPLIMWSTYIPFNIPWSISGDKDKVATINKNIVKLTSFRNKLPKLEAYLKDNYLKYYKGEDVHVMPDGRIMKGKTHEEYLKTLTPSINTQTSSSISTSTPSSTPNNINRGGY